MPPLLNDASEHKGGFFKAFRRGVYPTIDLPYEDDYTSVDHYFMGKALQQARKAQARGEVPIGALIVRECGGGAGCDCDGGGPPDAARRPAKRTFQILSAAHNRVEADVDASAHAELLALRGGARSLGNWRYPRGSRIYSTLEPCPMCLASIQAFRIDHVVYGAPDYRLGAIETHMDLMSVARHPYHEVKSVTGGVRGDECGDTLVHFFRQRRQEKMEVRKLLKLHQKKGDAGNMKKKRFRIASFVKSFLRGK